jgi:hypothetical protein
MDSWAGAPSVRGWGRAVRGRELLSSASPRNREVLLHHA